MDRGGIRLGLPPPPKGSMRGIDGIFELPVKSGLEFEVCWRCIASELTGGGGGI